MNKREPRKLIKGLVVSNKMDKTAVVKVVRKVKHPKYQKLVERVKKYYAHDEENKAEVGQEVMIMETRPLSKTKRFRIVQTQQSSQVIK